MMYDSYPRPNPISIQYSEPYPFTLMWINVVVWKYQQKSFQRNYKHITYLAYIN